jgi:HSP20 family protein
MTFGTRVRRYPLRGHADAVVYSERALAEFQRQLLPIANRGRLGSDSFAPTLRAVENQDDYLVSAELPGVASEDLSVVVEEGVLTLRGVRKSLDWSEDLGDEEKEALSTRFERSIRFNGEIDEGRVTARSKDGLLRIVVPKPEPPVPQVVTIPIEAG